MRHGDMAHVAAAAGFGVAVPLLLLDRLWTFVYSLIEATSRSFRRAVAIALAVTAATVFSTWESLGATPFWYICFLLAAVPAGALLGYRSKGKLS